MLPPLAQGVSIEASLTSMLSEEFAKENWMDFNIFVVFQHEPPQTINSFVEIFVRGLPYCEDSPGFR